MKQALHSMEEAKKTLTNGVSVVIFPEGTRTKTGETGKLPQDVEFYSAEKRSGGWLLSLKAKEREENHYHQILYNNFYDADGTEYEITNWSSTMGEESESGYFIETVPLKDFYDDEVWVKLCYSHLWTAEEPIEVKIK